MLRAMINKSWWQHPTKQQLYGHLPPIPKTIKVRRTRHAGHCWRSKGELISDVLLCNPSHDRAKPGRRARTYVQQLCTESGCNPEDLPEAMDDREWGERGSGISMLTARHDDDDDDDGLHLFWDSFEWFCLQISSEAKYVFLSRPRYCDRGLIVVIVYHFQIWNKKKHSLIISRVISCHMGAYVYGDSLSIYIYWVSRNNRAVTWVPCILRHAVYHVTEAIQTVGAQTNLPLL